MSTKITDKNLIRSEDGTIIIIWGMALVVVFGFMALIFDVGRVNTTHDELQTFADSVALAAAGELDGQSDAITRANAAAANLISDQQTFANGARALSGTVDYTLRFHSDLPASDLTPLGADVTNDPREAVFAEVVVTPRTLPMIFTGALRSMLGQGNTPVNALISASAVAGFTQEACDITPLMFCLPDANFKADNHKGEQILLRTGGSGAGWGPGDFGFLDPASAAALGSTCAGVNGLNNQVTCMMGAVQNITSCYSTRGVDTQPGQAVGIWNDVINMRFDRYSSNLNKYKSDKNYPPAPNLIQGEIGGCGNTGVSPSSNSRGFPHDSCFAAGTCSRFGTGTWDYQGYVGWNYGDPLYPTGGAPYDPTWDDHFENYVVTGAHPNSRYETYLKELAWLADHASNPLLTGRDETGIPQCFSGPTVADASRRVVIAAGIDCVKNPINGSEVDVPVAEFFKMFLTNPVGAGTGSPKKFDLYVEIIESAGLAGYSSAGSGGIFRDVVQLYR